MSMGLQLQRHIVHNGATDGNYMIRPNFFIHNNIKTTRMQLISGNASYSQWLMIAWFTLFLIAMSRLSNLLAEYGESHTNSLNKRIHFICVPAIFWSVCALLHCIKWNAVVSPFLNGLDFPVLLAVLVYYFRLSPALSIGFVIWGGICIALCGSIEAHALPLSAIALITFALAWIGQFYGHHVEGKKPSFLKDLQFLLIGPAWIMNFIYTKLGFSL
ncbi:MAG: DUF962 domain-containing protein [Sphingomonadales bacterium]